MTEGDKRLYEYEMDTLLDGIEVPVGTILHGDHCCSDDYHKFCLENYFNSLLNVIRTADLSLPRSTIGKGQKSYWSEYLSVIKCRSIESFELWLLHGKPSSGPIFSAKKDAYYKYKIELRRAQRTNDAKQSESLYNDLVDKDPLSFWKKWKRTSQTVVPPVTRIDGCSSDHDISNAFRNNFEKIFTNTGSPAHDKLNPVWTGLF
jgi:hypothetical protein